MVYSTRDDRGDHKGVGFDITYIPFGDGGQAYVEEMRSIARNLPLGEYYGIIGRYDQSVTLVHSTSDAVIECHQPLRFQC
jgi:hypothetical protein